MENVEPRFSRELGARDRVGRTDAAVLQELERRGGFYHRGSAGVTLVSVTPFDRDYNEAFTQHATEK